MLVDGDPGLCAEYAKLLPHLHNLYQLYQVLLKARAERGAIDFDSTETRIVFNAERKVERIVPVVRNDAHRLIEECMLAANVSAARYLQRGKLPALYRIHELPPPAKLKDLREFLAELALRLDGGDEPRPRTTASCWTPPGSAPMLTSSRPSCCAPWHRPPTARTTSATSGWPILRTRTSRRRSGVTPTSSCTAPSSTC
jgi:exoribonuclease R